MKFIPSLLRFRLAALLAGLAAASGLTAGLLWACGPAPPYILFSFSRHPDYPLQKYAQGNLGILLEDFSPGHLFVAYRALLGKPLEGWEFEQMKLYWQERKPQEPVSAFQAGQRWLRTVRQLTGRSQLSSIVVHRRPWEGWSHYLNCHRDAFDTARSTLSQRVSHFGATSRAVQSWLDAQTVVFSNCSGGRAIPPSADPDLPEIIRHDRLYQQAAAHFYSQEYEQAQRLFEAIAATPGSPWQPIAPYLAARCSIRMGTLTGPYTASLQDAERRLLDILNDSSQESIHDAARGSLHFVLLRLRPADLARRIEKRLMRESEERWQVVDLYELHMLAIQKPPQPEGGDLLLWVHSFNRSRQVSAVDEWVKNPSPAWTVAALMEISYQDERLPDLLRQAAQVEPASPAYASVTFYRSRLLDLAGRPGEARRAVDAAISSHPHLFPPSSLNAMRALRALRAPTLRDFLEDAARRPVALARDLHGQEKPVDRPEAGELFEGDEFKRFIANRRNYFDRDATWVLGHQLSLQTLLRVALEHPWQRHLKQELLQAVLVRAILLEQRKIALHAAKALLPLRPQLDSELRGFLEAEGERQDFAAWYLLARFPGLSTEIGSGIMRRRPLARIDNFRDNWWCPPSEHHYIGEILKFIHGGRIEPWRPDFLEGQEVERAAREQRRLAELPAAPVQLAARAIRYAERFPDDPRSPEILHLAVRSTRYGCHSADTGKASRAAFRLLHRRYPKSQWAEKTPYWYE
ncbi:MAG TPA: hypothetical protein VLU25_12150 [Acidobacteriota bacterium]|nr:hypothetical protein [Acidobacteriota bacterium]